MASKRKKGLRLTRDGFILGLGVVGLFNETILESEPRQVLVLTFAGMILGVPVIRAGDKEHDRRGEDGDDKT